MAKHKYGNTRTEQLWTELASATGKPVADIAHDFTLQGGVPLVTLTGAQCVGGKTEATLTQGRFGLDQASKAPQSWRVPLTLGIIGELVTRTIVQSAGATRATASGCGTLVLNRDKGSYTRVRYDAPGHAAIVRDFGKLALADQLGTLGDDFALAISGDQGFDSYVAILGAVTPDSPPLDWQMVAGQLGTLAGLFQGTPLEAPPLEAPLQARIIAILSPVMERVGFTARAEESPLVTNLRETLVGRLGNSGDKGVAARARSFVTALAKNPNAVPPAIRQPILNTYAANATTAEWDALLAITRAEKNPVAKNIYVRLLGQPRDAKLAARALELLKGDTLTAPQKASLLRSVAGRNPDLAFDFAIANRALVEGFVEPSARATFIPGLGGGSNDPAMIAKITKFGETLPEASRGGSKRTVTLIGARKQIADRLRASVARWLSAR